MGGGGLNRSVLSVPTCDRHIAHMDIRLCAWVFALRRLAVFIRAETMGHIVSDVELIFQTFFQVFAAF